LEVNMKITLTKKNDGSGRVSVREITEEQALNLCKEAISRSLWVATWTNEKGVRLATVNGKWEGVEALHSVFETV
jgi:hypothetical protein